jgi:hypothetical protein
MVQVAFVVMCRFSNGNRGQSEQINIVRKEQCQSGFCIVHNKEARTAVRAQTTCPPQTSSIHAEYCTGMSEPSFARFKIEDGVNQASKSAFSGQNY